MTQHTLRSLEKGLDLLALISERSTRLSMRDVCEALGLPRSTAYRFLSTFVAREFLEPDHEAGFYRPGRRLQQLGSAVLGALDLRGAARPAMQALSVGTAQSVFLMVRVDTDAVCIDKVEGPEGLQLSLRVGGRRPLHCSGIAKVLLAHLPDDELAAFISKSVPRFTPFTICNAKQLRAELAKTRRQGYAISTQEFLLGARSLGVPIRDFSGRVIAGLGLGGMVDRLPDSRIPTIVRMMKLHAAEISAKLGYIDGGTTGARR